MPQLSPLESAIARHASEGDIDAVDRLVAESDHPSESIRDLHIKAHLRAIPARTFPTTALSILHDYESRGLPAPQRSYTRLITTLLSLRSSVAEAQAWDLFAHMRYIAHPVPDAYLYTLMIAACASRAIAPQPARALDLFKEMTVDKGIPPTADTYTAAIYACACSGDKLYVGEAFRLAKEMLDGHRDAYGNTAFTPDRKTFCALLEGAKRMGDLAKVRWILAEIVAESLRTRHSRDAIVVDEQIMTHVFHAYAAYKPPFNRAATVLVDENAPPTSHGAQPTSTASQDPATEVADASVSQQGGPSDRSQLPFVPEVPQFTALLPQSHPEVLAETRVLFARILNDISPSVHRGGLDDPSGGNESMPHAFQQVRLTPRLLNAYLSVHYAHGLFDESAQLYQTLFEDLGVEKNAWSYVEALEYSGRSKRDARMRALAFARQVWEEWSPVEEAWRRGKQAENAAGITARLVERAYAAMIRILSL